MSRSTTDWLLKTGISFGPKVHISYWNIVPCNIKLKLRFAIRNWLQKLTYLRPDVDWSPCCVCYVSLHEAKQMQLHVLVVFASIMSHFTSYCIGCCRDIVVYYSVITQLLRVCLEDRS